MTHGDLAEHMGVLIQRINTLINEKQAVTAETALLLARMLRTTPELRLNLQGQYDLRDVRQFLKRAAWYRPKDDW